MRLLLDTHAFVWWADDPGRLPAAVVAMLRSTSHEVLLSVVSVWEVQVKRQVGKLVLQKPLDQIVREQQANGLLMLPVVVEHVLALDHLPLIHRDPFDRLLVAQAIVEGAALVSGDQAVGKYPVTVVW